MKDFAVAWVLMQFGHMFYCFAFKDKYDIIHLPQLKPNYYEHFIKTINKSTVT